MTLTQKTPENEFYFGQTEYASPTGEAPNMRSSLSSFEEVF